MLKELSVAKLMEAHPKTMKRGLFSFGVFLVLLLIHLLVSPFNIADGSNAYLDGDYGVLTNNALRILQGESLYSDIWTTYAPAADHLIAGLFLAFGDNLRSLRLALAVAGAISAFLLFSILRSLTTISWAIGITALSLLLGPFCLNFPYPNWFCLPIALGMLLLERKAWENKRMVHYFLAGVLGGAVFSLKPNYGVFAFLALICIQQYEVLFEPDRAPSGKSAPLSSVFLLILFPATALWLIKGHFTLKNFVFFLLPPNIIAAVWFIARQKSRGRRFPTNLQPLVYTSAGFALTVVPMFVYLLVQLGAAGFLKEFIYPTANFAQELFTELPAPSLEAGLLVFLFSFQGLLLSSPRRLGRLKIIFPLSFLLFTVIALYGLFPYMRVGLFLPSSGINSYSAVGFDLIVYLPLAVHTAWGFVILKDLLNLFESDRKKVHLSVSMWILPPVLMLAGVLFFRTFQTWKIGGPFSPSWQNLIKGISLIVFPLYLIILFGFPVFTYFVKIDPSQFRLQLSKFSDIRSARAGILMPAERARMFSGVIGFIQTNTQPTDFIFDMTGSFFYFLSDRRAPTKWGTFMHPRFFSQEVLQEIEFDLETTKPKVVVFSKEAERRFSTFYPNLYHYIRSRYRPAAFFGEYGVLVLAR
jgi:hypothetical protein